MKFLSPRQTSVFIPSCDLELPETEQTKFFIKTITLESENIIKDNMFSKGPKGDLVYSAASQQYWALQVGIGEIKCGDSHVLIPREDAVCGYGFKCIKDSFIESIPASVRVELVAHISSQLEPTEAQRKN